MSDTTTLARRPEQITDLTDMQLGHVLAQSGYFTDAKGEAQAVVKVLLGRELGIPPVQAMLGIHVIQGKPAIGSGLIATMVKRSGVYNYRVRRRDDTGCEIEFYEHGESVGVSSFTVDDAKRAGLLTNATWQKYPKAMCFARAMTDGVRTYCPDVFGAPIYTPEELGAKVRFTASGEQEVIEAELVPSEPVHPARQSPREKQQRMREEAPNVAAACEVQAPPSADDPFDGEEAKSGPVGADPSFCKCGKPLTEGQRSFSVQQYGSPLCPACQREIKSSGQ